MAEKWIPAFAGMTAKIWDAVVLFVVENRHRSLKIEWSYKNLDAGGIAVISPDRREFDFWRFPWPGR
jgi:hypothetical protein